MKKFLAILLSLLIILCCVSCDNSNLMQSPDEIATASIEIGPLSYKTYKPSDYINEDLYNSDYADDVFYNDQNDVVAYMANTMYHMFGNFDYDAEVYIDGQKKAWKDNAQWGTEPTWYEWMAEKFVWNANEVTNKNHLKTLMKNWPMTCDGYLWSWSTTPYWLASACMHYDGLFRYITAAYDIMKWENSTDFLTWVDTSTADGQNKVFDDSQGMTVYEKLTKIMDYILNTLNGAELGYIKIEEKSSKYSKYLEKGLKSDSIVQFGKTAQGGSVTWNNTGVKVGDVDPSSSNYWDNYGFGNIDGYESALFYQALNSMCGIERMLGNTTVANRYQELAKKVLQKFNETFWHGINKRYLGWIDKNGISVDVGMTFLNYEAMTYGLANYSQMTEILDWVDGERIVAGDDGSTGKDIFDFKSIYNAIIDPDMPEYVQQVVDAVKASPLDLKCVSRVSTCKMEKIPQYWHSVDGQIPLTVEATQFGRHFENGACIFYPAYYELMSRIKCGYTTDVFKRYVDLADVYNITELKTDLSATNNKAGPWFFEGNVGEYPESGLVPISYLHGIMGLDADYEGVILEPTFGDEENGYAYNTLGVNNMSYGNSIYNVEAYRNGSAQIKTSSRKGVDMVLKYKPVIGNKVTCVVKDAKAKTLLKETVSVDAYGYVRFDLKGQTAGRTVILTAGL